MKNNKPKTKQQQKTHKIYLKSNDDGWDDDDEDYNNQPKKNFFQNTKTNNT